MVEQRYQLIPSTDIDDQKILEYGWTRYTPGQTQPRVVVLDATTQISKISIGYFQ